MGILMGISKYISLTYLTMPKHENHICRFNDGEQSCDCYDEGFKAGIKHNKPTVEGTETEEALWGETWEGKYRCPNTGCDNMGTIAVRVSEEEWEPEQCQYCYEMWFPLRDAIRTLLPSARADERKNLVEVVKGFRKPLPYMSHDDCNPRTCVAKTLEYARDMEVAPYARKKLLGKTIPTKCACGKHWGHTGAHQPHVK
jgi:hypothetical protein